MWASGRWEPYVEAVLARQRRAEAAASTADTNAERETGLKERGVTYAVIAQDERGWLRLAG